MEAIKLRFTTPLHIGRGSEELDKTELVYHSDSLKSAIYSVGLKYFKNWQDPEYFFNGWHISSCFPYAGDEFLVPKPKLKRIFRFNRTPEDQASKKSKKIEFLSKSLFEDYINSREQSFEVDEDLISNDKSMIFTRKETSKKMIYRSEVQQRVLVGNFESDEETVPFYLDRIYFEKDCGLYFLVSFNHKELMDEIYFSLKLLGASGIGTDRSVGNGLFDFDLAHDVIKDFEFNINSNLGQKIILGLYLPSEKEFANINLEESAWSLIKRGGYMAGSDTQELTHLRRKSIFMFSEASVFSSEKEIKGTFVDLKPSWSYPIHPVWRCGMPIIINI